MRLTRALAGDGRKWLTRFVDRIAFEPSRNRTWRIFRGVSEIGRNRWEYGVDRPWTEGFRLLNLPWKRTACINRLPPISATNWKYFRGDRVEVLVGPDRGKQGIVAAVIRERHWLVIEGLNLEYVEQSEDKQMPNVTLTRECPLRIDSEVKLVDPSDERVCEVDWRYDDAGNRVRVSRRTGRVIPRPAQADELLDPSLGYFKPANYQIQDVDTPSKSLQEITFQPKLKTFEQDIMDEMGIKESRKRAKTYWY